MEHVEKSEQLKAMLYDHAGIYMSDFREELEKILSSSLFEFRIGKGLGGAGTLIPTLGKDIYNTLKGKIFKKPFENNSSMMFFIKIVTDDMVTEGRIITDNHNDIIEGTKNVKEMFANASKINVSEIEHVGTETILDRDKLITERCNFVFHYDYSASEAKWVLKKISLIEKVI
jgi:hypothetical protein